MSGRSVDISLNVPQPETDWSPTEESPSALLRPRFFAGQLLTEQDLNSLLRWTQERFHRAGQRDGWGVVSGLEVQADPDSRERVLVLPGLALDAGGRDLALPHVLGVDLGELARGDLEEQNWPRRLGESPPHTIEIAGHQQHTKCLRVFDLALSYREEPAESVAALPNPTDSNTHDSNLGCSERRASKPSRQRELSTVVATPAVVGCPPGSALPAAWQKRIVATDEVLEELLAAFPPLCSCHHLSHTAQHELAHAVKHWLLEWIASHPLYQLAFLESRIRQLHGVAASLEEELASVLFWLVQDARLRVLAHVERPSSTVPLARVWLLLREGSPRVLFIDGQPPLRRILGESFSSIDSRWPAPAGCWNLGRTLLRRWDDACAELSVHGLRPAAVETVAPPDTFEELRAVLRTEIFAPLCPSGRPLTVRLLDGGPLGRRAVAFTFDEATQTGLGMMVEKTLSAERVHPGERVVWEVLAINSGEEALQVTLVDSLLGELTSPGGVRVEPGDRIVFTDQQVIPEDAPERLRSRVDAVGKADDGRRTQASALHVLFVEHIQRALALTKTTDHTSAFPYQEMTWTYTATNTGSEDLEVTLTDPELDQDWCQVFPLRAGASHTVQACLPLPGSAHHHFKSHAVARGRDGEETVEIIHHHTLAIDRPDDFTLIGMTQRLLDGRLTDATLAYRGQIFTFAHFAAASPDRLFELFEPWFGVLIHEGRALVAHWQERAGWLRDAGLHHPEDIVKRSAERLCELLPKLSPHRVRVLKKRARRKLEGSQDGTVLHWLFHWDQLWDEDDDESNPSPRGGD